jgi:uncharacterized delta-60 repeat protein
VGICVVRFARLRALTVAAALVVAAFAATAALAAAGDLDPTFGTNGKVVTDISTRDEIHAVALQGDGKILGVGWSGTGTDQSNAFLTADIAVARYTTSGAPDSSWGNGGIVTTDLGGADIGLAAAVQSDGKLVVAGATGDPNTLEGNTALVRYKTDGTLDSSFGSNGVVINDFGGDEEWSGLAVLGNGKIVAGGFTGTAENQDFLLARFNSDGSLDTTFGCASPPCTGWTSTGFGALDEAYALAVQPDGKIVLSGFTGTGFNGGDFALARYSANGVLDPAFGSGGKVVTDIGGPSGADNAHSVAIARGGKIVAAGTTSANGGDFALARYNSDGSLDPTFGCASPPCSGKVEAGDPGHQSIESVAFQKDNKIVVAGGNGGHAAVARFTVDGQLDPRFGSGGIATTAFGTSDVFEGVAIQPRDGKIVGGGSTRSTDRDFALARYSG